LVTVQFSLDSNSKRAANSNPNAPIHARANWKYQQNFDETPPKAKNNNNNKRRRTREKRDEIENAPSHDGVAREDCVFFVARIREFKREEEEEEEEKTPMDITEKKNAPPKKRKANSLKIITCMRYFYLPTISYVDSS
tara:strand:+ start:1057 stop:1470 length:414 start_codon:yes stop_codon:yes gene_type:complete